MLKVSLPDKDYPWKSLLDMLVPTAFLSDKNSVCEALMFQRFPSSASEEDSWSLGDSHGRAASEDELWWFSDS